MNKSFFFALAIGTAMAGIACGDDTGSGGSATTSTGATGSTKAATASGTGTGSTKSTGTGATTGGSTSSGMAMGPCVDECMNDAGCDAMPPAPMVLTSADAAATRFRRLMQQATVAKTKNSVE